MIKVLGRLPAGWDRVVFDLAVLLVAVSVAFNFFAFARLTAIAEQNNINGRIIKAATGCENADTVAACKRRIGEAGAAQLAGYLQQQDCWNRRALRGLPAPLDYRTPCVLPR